MTAALGMPVVPEVYKYSSLSLKFVHFCTDSGTTSVEELMSSRSRLTESVGM